MPAVQRRRPARLRRLVLSQVPVEILYSVIGVLTLAVLTLAGLWVRAHDAFRQWATSEFVQLAKDVAAMKLLFEDVRTDIRNLDAKLGDHAKEELSFQKEILSKFGGPR